MGAICQGKFSFIAVLFALALAFVTGCGSNDSSGSNAAATVKNAESAPVQASLHPVRESGVSGKIVFVAGPSESLLVKVRLHGLHKATGLTQYMIWQMGSRHNMTFYKSYPVPHGGTLSASFEPTMQFLNWLRDGSKTQILITRVKDVDLFLLEQEHWPTPTDPTEIGVPVARGKFIGPLVGTTAG
jgi:hypothetical protein